MLSKKKAQEHKKEVDKITNELIDSMVCPDCGTKKHWGLPCPKALRN